jgi:hypothetical protein
MGALALAICCLSGAVIPLRAAHAINVLQGRGAGLHVEHTCAKLLGGDAIAQFAQDRKPVVVSVMPGIR